MAFAKYPSTSLLSSAPSCIGDASASPERGGAALGTDAKYKNTGRKVDPETGEILGFIDPMAGRLQRFMLQSVTRKLLPQSRTNNCLRVRQGGKQIQVHKSIEHGTASYSGLQTCGSVWVCPVCAAKIAERRRAEIIAAMAAHNAAGGCVHMLTLTAPHQRGDDLAELLANQAKALNSFWNDRQVKTVLLEMGTVGQIRALEVTHGRKSAHNNGWHPHYHVLLFNGLEPHLMRFDSLLQEQMTEWTLRLYSVWARVCATAQCAAVLRFNGVCEPDAGLQHKLRNACLRGQQLRTLAAVFLFFFISPIRFVSQP